MSCDLTTGFSRGCRNSKGGIKNVYFTELANKDTLTAASGVITAFTLNTGKQFFKYEMAKQVSNFTEAHTSSRENGTLFYLQVANVILNKMEAVKRNEILLLNQNINMIIMEDNNGKFWLLGETNGMEHTTGESGSGTTFGDRNGYTLEFTGEEGEMAQEVDSTLIAALSAPAA